MKSGMWCHVEIHTDDAEKAQAFYREVFGWKFQNMPMSGETYRMYETGEGGIGGGILGPNSSGKMGMVNYILVDEIEDSVAKVVAAGGSVVVPKTEVEHAGWFSLVKDPSGNQFGFWKSAHPQQ